MIALAKMADSILLHERPSTSAPTAPNDVFAQLVKKLSALQNDVATLRNSAHVQNVAVSSPKPVPSSSGPFNPPVPTTAERSNQFLNFSHPPTTQRPTNPFVTFRKPTQNSPTKAQWSKSHLTRSQRIA